jgi:putative transposase
MGLPRSTFYDAPAKKTDDAEIVARITAICEEFECYGYRRVGARAAASGDRRQCQENPPYHARA